MGERILDQAGAPWKRRLRKLLAAFLAVYLAGWAAVNLVANSKWVRQKIGNRVQTVMGTPLEVGSVVVTPCGGVRLKDLKIEVKREREGGDETLRPLFESREIRVVVSLLSLVTKSVKVKSVEVREPVFSLVREEGGGFVLPPGLQGGGLLKVTKVEPGGSAASPENPAGGASTVEGASRGGMMVAGGTGEPGMLLRNGGTSMALPGLAFSSGGTAGGALAVAVAGDAGQPVGGVPPSGEKQPPSGPLEFRHGARRFLFDDIMMRRGLVQVFSIDGERSLLRVEDVMMRISVQSEGPLSGTFEAERAVLFDRIEAASLRSAVATDGMLFKFTEFEAEMSGGKIEGQFHTSPFYPGIPFVSSLQVKGIAVPALTAKMFPDLDFDSGAVEGLVTMIGHLRVPSSYSGQGEFKVNDGHLSRNGLLDPFAGSIDVSGLRDIEFDEAVLRFSVGGGNVRVDEVRVSSPQIVLAGRGFVNFGGKLSFASRLYVNQHAHHAITMIEKRLPEGVGLGYMPAESNERFYRDYLVGGYVQNPVIDFWKGRGAVRMLEIREQILKLLEAPKSG